MTHEDQLIGEAPLERTQEAWRPSASGLGLYIGSFRVRLILVVLGYCVALLAVALKLSYIAKAHLVGMPALGGVTGAVMAAGVVRYARFPRGVGGRAMAGISLVLLVASIIAEVYAIVLALHTLGIAVVPASLDAQARGAFSAVWRLPWVTAASQLALLLSLLCLLVSFLRVAGSLEARAVVRRARRAMGGVILAIGLLVELRYAEFRGSVAHDAAVLVGIGVLAVACVAIAMSLGAASYLQVYVCTMDTDREPNTVA
jgi:hypothetical protein